MLASLDWGRLFRAGLPVENVDLNACTDQLNYRFEGIYRDNLTRSTGGQ